MSTSPEPKRKVLLVGWDAADWKFARPLMAAGHLPALSALVGRGVMGNIATLQPALSPMLWTSIATGKLADQHGVLGFLEADPENSEVGVRPVSVGSRRVKALWNMLDERGLAAHVVGWYASHPAEAGRGVIVSNRFFETPEASAWSPPDGSVYPSELAEMLSPVVVRPDQIVAAQMREFIPGLDGIDRAMDSRPGLLARQLARTASVQGVATAILQNEPWDFLGVYFDGIDVLGHHFMPYHPPRMAGVSERDFELYREVMVHVYQFHDMMLARLVQLAGPEATVVLVSDHGFHCDHGRPAVGGGSGGGESAAANPAENPVALDAAWHRSLGVFVAAGPGLRRGERIYGASILDVTPTVLTMFGLPVAQDMDGRVMVEAFQATPSVERIPTWEGGAGSETVAPAAAATSSAAADRAVIEQLIALGYLSPLSASAEKNAAEADMEARFALATVYLSTQRPSKALPLLEALYRERPADGRVVLQMAQCYYNLNRAAECAAVLNAGSGLEAANPGTRAMLLGAAELSLGHLEEAEKHFAAAEIIEPGSAGPVLLRGEAQLSRGEWGAAEATFRRAIALDGDSAQAFDGLAAALIQLRRFEEAVEAGLDAVGRLHYFPAAHFHLGVALVGMRDYIRAMHAFETSLAMGPGQRDAHRWLATIHRKLGDRTKAADHRDAALALSTG